jgi:hypothetical protein
MLKVIEEFDLYLSGLNLEFEAVIMGGGALAIMGITDRVTRDIDCVAPEIPTQIKSASEKFCKDFPNLGLDKNWLNNGPISIIRDLTDGWRDRSTLIFKGKSVTLYSLGRIDLIKTKLWALCDRSTVDLQDLLKLKPTISEIDDAREWVIVLDGNPDWPKHVDLVIKKLKINLGYE